MDLDEARALFPRPERGVFLNHAGVSPLCLPAAEAIRRYTELARDPVASLGVFFRRTEQVRQAAARMLNADPEEITFVKNTTEGIIWAAHSLNWRQGDNVVTSAIEFPANIYPWMALREVGVELRLVEPVHGRIPVEALAAAMDERTRILTLSAVQYSNGFRADLTALGRMCRQREVLFCVDAIQMLGVLPIDVRAMHIDMLAADGHKWLCGPLSCGIFYVRRDLIERLRPVLAGWMCMRNPHDYSNYHYDLVNTACRFDTGSYNIAGIYGLGACIDLFLAAGIERIGRRILELTDRLVEGLQRKGYRLASPRGPGEASGIVSFASDDDDVQATRDRLEAEHGIFMVVRDGRLRASPHFYQTEEEIDAVIAALP